MDSGVIGSIAGLVVLITLSAYFSATETAFTSLNRIRVKSLAEGGDKRAALVQSLSQDYGRMLSTILVGNNIVNIAATSIATVMFVGLMGSAGATVSTIVMTVVVLIFGEISPKTLANESPERFAFFSAPILRVFMVILKPVNFFFAQWKKLLTRLFKSGGSRAITEEELLTIVDEARSEGAIEEGDEALIHNVMEFNDSKVSDILTPRVDIEAIELKDSQEEITQLFISTGYTRLPVYQNDVDHIVGVLHLRDYFESLQEPGKPFTEMMGPVGFVTPFAKISEVLKLLQAEKSHLAVVTDEYGGTVGIVTMEDILEELVGEIWDEHDEVVEEMQPQADGSWLVSGNADVDRVFEVLGVPEEPDCTTMNGWIMERLGKVPQAGDRFTHDRVEVEVLSADNNRVETARVVMHEEAPPQEAAEGEKGAKKD